MNKEIKALFLIIFFIILINLISAQESKFDIKDSSTWPEDFEKLREVSVEDKNAVWSESSDFIKKYVADSLANKIRSTARNAANELKRTGASLEKINALSPLGKFYYNLGEQIEKSFPYYKINMIGFESNNLRWEEGFILSDGNVEIDLERINPRVVEVKYIPSKDGQKSKLVYKFKDGGEIVVGKGKINEALQYESDSIPTSLEIKGKTYLIPNENGKIEIDEKGWIKIENGAQVKVGDKIFEQYSKISGEVYLKIIGEEYFLVESKQGNAKITTNKAVLRIINEDKPTHVIFKKGDYSDLEQYVQIYDDKIENVDGKSINLKGEGIKVDLKKDFLFIKGDGYDLVVDNGRLLVSFQGEKTYVNRYGEGAQFNAKLINLQNSRQEITVTPRAVSYELDNPDRLLRTIELKHKDAYTLPSLEVPGEIMIPGKKLSFKIDLNENGKPIITAVSQDNGDWIFFDKSLDDEEFRRFLYGSKWSPFDGQSSKDIELIERLHNLYRERNGVGSIGLVRNRGKSDDDVDIKENSKEYRMVNVEVFGYDTKQVGQRTSDVGKNYIRLISGTVLKDEIKVMGKTFGVPPQDFVSAVDEKGNPFTTPEQLGKYLADKNKRLEILPLLDLSKEYSLIGKDPTGIVKAKIEAERGKISEVGERPFIDGKDIYESFFSTKKENGKYKGMIPNIEEHLNVRFSDEEKQALSDMLKQHLPESKRLPGSLSRLYVTSGEKPEIIIEIPGEKIYRAEIIDTQQVKTLNKIYSYSLFLEDDDLKRETNGKYNRAIDFIFHEVYPKKAECYKWPCVRD